MALELSNRKCGAYRSFLGVTLVVGYWCLPRSPYRRPQIHIPPALYLQYTSSEVRWSIGLCAVYISKISLSLSLSPVGDLTPSIATNRVTEPSLVRGPVLDFTLSSLLLPSSSTR